MCILCYTRTQLMSKETPVSAGSDSYIDLERQVRFLLALSLDDVIVSIRCL